MQNMLAYTIRGGINDGDYPQIFIGQGPSKKVHVPANRINDSYWFYFLDRSNPVNVTYETTVPASNNSSIPSGLMTYMDNPDLLFGVVTQYLSTLHVPQGDLYDLFVKYGASRSLQRLEQVNTSMGCGYFGRMSYALIGQCGPRGSGLPPASYDAADIRHGALLTVSLMPGAGGKPPYSICDCNTFITR